MAPKPVIILAKERDFFDVRGSLEAFARLKRLYSLLGAADTKGKIVLKAAADAPALERFPIAVLGQISINFVVKVSHASEPVFLSVKK